VMHLSVLVIDMSTQEMFLTNPTSWLVTVALVSHKRAVGEHTPLAERKSSPVGDGCDANRCAYV
jgi:hypothetical protein